MVLELIAEEPVVSSLKRHITRLSILGTVQLGSNSTSLHERSEAKSLRHNPVAFLPVTQTPLELFQVRDLKVTIETLGRLIHPRSTGAADPPATIQVSLASSACTIRICLWRVSKFFRLALHPFQSQGYWTNFGCVLS